MPSIVDILESGVHRWLTPKAESYDSPSHGLGIRAKEDIKKGEDILVYGGIILHSSQMEEYWKLLGHVGTQIDETFFIVPISRKT